MKLYLNKINLYLPPIVEFNFNLSLKILNKSLYPFKFSNTFTAVLIYSMTAQI